MPRGSNGAPTADRCRPIFPELTLRSHPRLPRVHAVMAQCTSSGEHTALVSQRHPRPISGDRDASSPIRLRELRTGRGPGTSAGKSLIKGPGRRPRRMVASVLVAKYAWHLPLYRQAQMLLSQGIPERGRWDLGGPHPAAELKPLYLRLQFHSGLDQDRGRRDGGAGARSGPRTHKERVLLGDRSRRSALGAGSIRLPSPTPRAGPRRGPRVTHIVQYAYCTMPR